jgi:CheY-like chemotaxis protein
VTAVLVAEDDRAVREFVSRALLKSGYDVTAVADGVQALEALQTSVFDMLLADIAMPEMDGITLALKVAKDYPDLPILLMTGYASERQRADNLDALIHDVIAKPFTLQQIRAVTAEVLARTHRESRTLR